MPPALTAEQLAAVGRRSGNLLLDASAGSGKTSVLVERFALSVLEDGLDPSAILTITFTEKAAAEMRERIRVRLRESGAQDAARAAEAAPISTIHGFCARLLRGHTLAAGLDPRFRVLDQPAAERLAALAVTSALEAVAAEPAGRDLIASYGLGPLRDSVLSVHEELRARGHALPVLPRLAAPPDLEPLRQELTAAADALAAELGAVAKPAVRVSQALERMDRCREVLGQLQPGLRALGELTLPGGNGAALSSAACERYSRALLEFRRGCRHHRAVAPRAQLDDLLQRFTRGYAELKRAQSALDFADLELGAHALLSGHPRVRARLQSRFARVMVDELQDTNPVQLELAEMLAAENLFTVGDAQQSIYGFRHADPELFQRLGRARKAAGERLSLSVNFRTRPEILAVINRTFASELGDVFRPLQAARAEPADGQPRVELLLADKEAERSDGLAAPWRAAEAGALARRVHELVADGVSPQDIVVLTRASTDLRVYERALEAASLPTYVIGGRGYWTHPQVIDLVAYLRALANPLEEEALFTVLISPLVGLSLDSLVLLAAAAAEAEEPVWARLEAGAAGADPLSASDRERLNRFCVWFARERRRVGRTAISELVERALQISGYDLKLLALPGGRRRLANVRKLMRLARQHGLQSGPDLRGFLDVVWERVAHGSDAAGGDPRESEAPVEGEALNAIRLMTIHRSKGLEFGVVCVADLGRGPRSGAELMRIGDQDRFGLRLIDPDTGTREPALEFEALGAERRERERAEERRLFYVAMTRARERLILSGAAKLGEWPPRGGAPISWIAPAMLPQLSTLRSGGGGIADGVRVSLVEPASPEATAGAGPALGGAQRARQQPPADVRLGGTEESLSGAAAGPAAPSRLSYTALAEYGRCGYRFYAERVLGLPSDPAAPAPPPARPGPTAAAPVLGPRERGVLVHAALRRLDFRRPASSAVPTPAGGGPAGISAGEAAELDALLQRFAASELCRRLGRAGRIRREQPFTFTLRDGWLITGTFDVLAYERSGTLLVVDYKSDRLRGVPPVEAAAAYRSQQLVYALAALRSGSQRVEVAHLFLEAPEDPVLESFDATSENGLLARLEHLTAGIRSHDFRPTDEPQLSVCHGCPAEAGLCSWPPSMTRRSSTRSLF